MLLFVALLGFTSAFTDFEYETGFNKFLNKHNKVYEGDEIAYRFSVFKKSMDEVEEHNSKNHSWFKAINRFSDLTNTEFERMMLGYLPRGDNAKEVHAKHNPSGFKSGPGLAQDVDWRKTAGALTPVKDQGQCGSCWAFSTTGGIEGAEYISTHQPAVSLSEQALVDCSGSFGNQGCNGGLMDNGFKYVEAHGLPKEGDYPYHARDESCHTFTPVATSKIVTFTDTTDLENDIVKQPISVAVDARKWSQYGGGVFECGFWVQLDHGVLLVGQTADYWIVKNSWGPSWGENGFIRVTKKHMRNCGIAKSASYPSLNRTSVA